MRSLRRRIERLEARQPPEIILDTTRRYSFPGGGSKWQVSSGGVAFSDNNVSVADWSPDGKQLYYRQENKIYTVEAHTDGSKPEFSAPKEISGFPQELDSIALLTEGKRIMATRPIGQHSESPLNLALNWQRLMQ